MTSRRRFIATGAAALAAMAAPSLRAQRADASRVALVIGNDHYREVPLDNATNDARAMADLLKSAGFRVDARYDADGKALGDAVKAFGEAIARPETKLAFFYYAGHGVQVDWRNYLLPVDANIASAEELRRQCLDLGVLLAALGKAQGKEYVIMLDACRDNPLGAAWHPERKGLSQFDAPVGSLIAFATAPGSTASDGGRRHGLYTENLVRELAVKDCKLEDALKRVRVSVRLASQGAQVPWESTSLESDVILFPGSAPPAPADDERRFEEELARWNAVKRSRDPAELGAFVRDYPDGQFSEIAQARIAMMLAARHKPGGGRGVIQIDDTHPVPAALGKSANPYSAGTYALDRHFTVGDEARYRELDPATGAVKRTFTQRVTKVDHDADRVEYNGGSMITDTLGNLLKTPQVEYDAPVQGNPAELQVGKRWSARFHASRRRGEADIEMRFEIVARERVVVPAGEFDAFRIEGHGLPVKMANQIEERMESARRAGRAQRMQERAAQLGSRVTIWDVPGLNFVVKRESVVHRPGGRPPLAETIELVALRQGAEG